LFLGDTFPSEKMVRFMNKCGEKKGKHSFRFWIWKKKKKGLKVIEMGKKTKK